MKRTADIMASQWLKSMIVTLNIRQSVRDRKLRAGWKVETPLFCESADIDAERSALIILVNGSEVVFLITFLLRQQIANSQNPDSGLWRG
jgi:hypothetical protein